MEVAALVAVRSGHQVGFHKVEHDFAEVVGAVDAPLVEDGPGHEPELAQRVGADALEEFQRELPPAGSRIVTAKGQGRVLAQEILARKVLIEFEDGRRLMVGVAEVLSRLG